MHTTATIRIQRFNPDVDRKPYFDQYQVAVNEEKTLLNALHEIKTTQDGSLTFRRSCRHAICGSCAVNVNGQNMLVCHTPLQDVLDRKGRVTLRPLPYQPIIRDLVVDRSVFWQQYERIKPWLVPSGIEPEKEFRLSPDEVAALHEAETCIMCGACYAACPIVGINPRYIGPHALQKLYTRVMDARDGALAERLDLVEQHDGIYGCRTVTTCISDCPKGLNPTRAISTLRQIALRRARFETERAERQAHLLEPTG